MGNNIDTTYFDDNTKLIISSKDAVAFSKFKKDEDWFKKELRKETTKYKSELRRIEFIKTLYVEVSFKDHTKYPFNHTKFFVKTYEDQQDAVKQIADNLTKEMTERRLREESRLPRPEVFLKPKACIDKTCSGHNPYLSEEEDDFNVSNFLKTFVSCVVTGLIVYFSVVP